MGNLIQDLRYGLRMLAKNPGFTAVAVVTLALGIGANTAIFSVINGVVLRWLPVEKPEQLVSLRRTLPRGGMDEDFSQSTYEQFRVRSRAFSGMFAIDVSRQSMTIDAQPELVDAEFVSGSYFQVLGVSAMLGRTFTPEDDLPGKPLTAVISHKYWNRRFGHDALALRKQITVKGLVFSIVGVAPPELPSPDIWIPMVTHPSLALADHSEVSIVARLKPAINEQEAASELTLIFQQILTQAAGYGLTAEGQRGIRAQRILLVPAGRGGSRRFSTQLKIVLAIVAMVLLIACANVANLLLARATTRQKEIAVRLALGAGRGRLIRQLLTESILLALCGGIVGILLAPWVANLSWVLVSYSGVAPPIDSRVLGFTVSVSVLTGVIFGLLPAVQTTRVDLAPTLKEGSRALTAWRPPQAMGRVLVVSQMALCLVLLVGAGLFVRSLQNLNEVDVGFNRRNVLLAEVYPTLIGYEGAGETNLYWRLLERIGAIPGVRSASLSRLRLTEGYWSRQIFVAGPHTGHGQEAEVSCNPVSPKFFETMGIPLLLGRDFTAADAESGPRVAVVSQTLAELRFRGQNPIGKRFLFEGERNSPVEIVGLAGNIKSGFEEDEQDFGRAVYIPFTQSPLAERGQAVLELRTASNPATVVAALRREVQAVEKALPLVDIGTQDETVKRSFEREGSLTTLSGVFALLALLMASIALYGTVSYSVSRRTNEIGIRMALGARQKDVLWMVLKDTILLIMGGICIGLPCSIAASRLLASQLYGVKPTDALTLSLGTVMLGTVAALAGYLPARRASRIDPMVALRYE